MYPLIFTHPGQNIACPSTDSTGHGQLLNGTKMDFLLALLSKIAGIFMVDSRDKTNFEGFPAPLHRQNG